MTGLYGCHSTVAPDRFKDPIVRSKGVIWMHRMSTLCRYDRRESDVRCRECTHVWDVNYVESLK